MFSISIRAQKEELRKKLTTELLSEYESNKEDIKGFVAGKYGKSLEGYLHNKAWEEDSSGETKVYLVRDQETRTILFFFALKAGLVYQDIGDDEYELTEQEEEIVQICIENKLNQDPNYTPDEVLSWYEDSDINKDKLLKVIEARSDVKIEAERDRNQNYYSVSEKQVLKTFPGIVLTHFCKNIDNTLYDNLDFPLGFYVFWEIVVEKVLEISKYIGCKFFYLFAADQTEDGEASSIEDIIYDLDEDEKPKARRLVDYYKSEFKFEEPSHLSILKPYYDYQCFSLVQPIAQLADNRKASWIQHSDIDEEQRSELES